MGVFGTGSSGAGGLRNTSFADSGLVPKFLTCQNSLFSAGKTARIQGRHALSIVALSWVAHVIVVRTSRCVRRHRARDRRLCAALRASSRRT
jgi:hypothetical protein